MGNNRRGSWRNLDAINYQTRIVNGGSNFRNAINIDNPQAAFTIM